MTYPAHVPTLEPLTPQETAAAALRGSSTAPHGNANFSPGDHVEHWTADETAAYLRGDFDTAFAAHQDCKDGHARV